MPLTDAQIDAALSTIDHMIELAASQARQHRHPHLVAMRASGAVVILGRGLRAVTPDLHVLAHVREDEITALHPRLLAARTRSQPGAARVERDFADNRFAYNPPAISLTA